MIQVSQLLFSLLSSYTELTTVVSNRIYPVLAPENAVFPFVVYGFGEVPTETKDASGYMVNVAVWFEQNKVTEALQMADDLKVLIEDHDFEFINTNVNFDADNLKIYSEINFKIIK